MKIFFIFLLIIISASANAQEDSTKKEEYAIVVATGKLLSNKVTIDVDFGEEKKFWTGDSRIRDEGGKLKKFNSVVDAMNYMGSMGWNLTATLLIGNGPYVYHYVFKK